MQDFMDGLVSVVLIPALLALIAYVVQRAGDAFTKKTGVEIDAVVSLQMHAAIERFMLAAFAKAGYDPALSQRDPKILNEVMAGAQGYVEKMNPDALKRFGVDKVKEAIAKHAGEV